MKNKLFLVAFTLTTLLYRFDCHAQHQVKPAEERATQITEWMKSNLKLNEEQAFKVQDINLRYAKKNDELKSASGSKRQKLQTLKKNETSKDAELKAVLNESQYDTYQKKKAELKKKFKEKKMSS